MSNDFFGKPFVTASFRSAPINREKIDVSNPRPHTTYKYVDLEHVEAIESGRIKIGTLSGYADLEDETRRDDAEGVAHHYIRGIQVGEGDETGINAAAAVGLIVNPEGNSKIRIQDSYSRASTPPAYCFCLSLISDSASLLAPKPQAIFQVDDTFRLAFVLRDKYPERFGKVNFGHVQYTGRTRIDYQVADQVPPWLRKEVRHYEDREFRILFFAPDGHLPDVFITENDPEIASFFRRIA